MKINNRKYSDYLFTHSKLHQKVNIYAPQNNNDWFSFVFPMEGSSPFFNFNLARKEIKISWMFCYFRHSVEKNWTTN